MKGPERWPGFLLGPPGARGRRERNLNPDWSQRPRPQPDGRRGSRQHPCRGPGDNLARGQRLASKRLALSRASLLSAGLVGEAGEERGHGSAAKAQS